MKIAVIGNMNNMYFSLTRYLIDYGFDCDLLILNNEPSHFHPSCDTYQDDYLNYCKQLNWGDPANFLRQDFKQVETDLEKYDFLIGSGSVPAFITRIGRKLDMFIPYGDDLYSLPFFKIVHPFRIPAYLVTAYYQRKGIQNSPYIMFDKTNAGVEKEFARLKYKGKRIISPPPLLYHKEYDKSNLIDLATNNPFYPQLKKIRESNDLIIVQHLRQVWKKNKDKWAIKGNDKLIKGFSAFKKNNPRIKIKLILFEYGVDVAHSKRLIAELKIQDDILWFPKMPRKQIMLFLYYSDLIVGELFHSWLTSCIVLEALCMGKPVMQKRNDEEFMGEYVSLYPMLHADTPQTVLKGIQRLIENKEEIEQIGRDGQKWFLHYCVNKPVAEIINVIKKRKFESVSKYSF